MIGSFKVEVELKGQQLDNAKLMAIQNKMTIQQLIQETVSSIMSGESAYIFLNPAPLPETLQEVKEAVKKVLGRERTLIYTKNGKGEWV